jgi:hypothetical protein
MPKTRIPIASALAVAAVALSACSASVDVGGKTISKGELEKQVTASLAKLKGVPVEQVPKLSCPEDLEAKVGATTTCKLGEPGSGVYDVAVKVDKLDEATNNASFTIKVASQPN